MINSQAEAEIICPKEAQKYENIEENIKHIVIDYLIAHIRLFNLLFFNVLNIH